MKLNLQRYSLGGDGYRQPSMMPNPLGEFVRVADVEELLRRILELAEPATPKALKLKCGRKIELGTEGIAHTYCELDLGHKEKCA